MLIRRGLSPAKYLKFNKGADSLSPSMPPLNGAHVLKMTGDAYDIPMHITDKSMSLKQVPQGVRVARSRRGKE